MRHRRKRPSEADQDLNTYEHTDYWHAQNTPGERKTHGFTPSLSTPDIKHPFKRGPL